jgi:integrase
MPKPLTDPTVAGLKPTRGQIGWREISDGATRGLCIRLSPSGEKVWAVRHVVGGRRQRHTLGAYPAVTLSEARKRASGYLAAAREGMSPEQVNAFERGQKMTVGDAHREYLVAVAPTLRASTLAGKRSVWSHHLAPRIGSRLLRTITKADVKAAVGDVAREYPIQANRVFAELMALLRWCEERDLLRGVPAVRRKAAGGGKETPRDRVLDNAELVAVWTAAGEMGSLTRDFLRLLVLTGARRDEVRLMTWEEVDLGRALWTIPASRYKTGAKTGAGHAVPLSAPALEILKARHSDGATGYVLKGREDGKPFAGQASVMRRLLARKVARPFVLHDLRRTLRTGLAALRIDAQVAEAVIGHVPAKIVRTYTLHAFLDEKREALDAWAAHVLRLVGGESNVVTLARVSR